MKTPVILTISCVWLATIAVAYLAGRGSEAGGAASQGTSQVAAVGRDDPSPGAVGNVGSGAAGVAVAPWSATGGKEPDATGNAPAMGRLRLAMAETNALVRTRGVLDVLEGLDSAGLQAAADILREEDQGMGSRSQMALLMYAWGRKDPEAALAYNKANDNERANFSVLGAWAEVAPDKAIAYAAENAPVKENGEPDENWQMLGVIHGLVKVDPGKATEAVERMPFGQARSQGLDMVLDKLWKQDPEAAQRWATGVADEKLRGGAANRVASRLAGEDPAKATAWAESLTDYTARSHAMAGVIEVWGESDPNAAGAWLNSVPATPDTDEPRERFSFLVEEKDPQSALAWAGTISNPEWRERTVARVARRWLKRDQESARAVLSQMPNLPESVRARMAR